MQFGSLHQFVLCLASHHSKYLEYSQYEYTLFIPALRLHWSSTTELVDGFPSDYVESSDALILQNFVISAPNKYTVIQKKKLHSSPIRVFDTSEQSIREHFRGKIPQIFRALGGISLNLVLILMILRKSKAVLIASPWHIDGGICFGSVADSFNPQRLRESGGRSARLCLPPHFHKAPSKLN